MNILQLYLRLSMLASRARVAKVSDHKFYDRSNLIILSPKQMLQRLPITLAKVKAGHTSENILNKIFQIIYSLYWEKEIINEVYNKITSSVKL